MAQDRQICKMDGKQRSVKPGRDRWGTMFSRKEDFLKSLGIDIKAMPASEREKGLKECILAIVAESMELLNEINWKPWKKTKKEVDQEQARFEVADQFLFLLEESLYLGMDAETLFQYVMRKVDINEERQKNKY